nr:glycosyltransferase family 2 protein [uncultured Blautia sp.]
MKKHYISVAMCTYNGEKYVAEQLKSILNQNHPVDEIVIGDDGSTDRTVEIIEEILKTSKVKYKIIQNETNLGYRKNFENVIANTKGDIIFLSDQDDVWLEEKVKTLINDLEQDEQYMLVFSDAYIVDSTLNKMSESLWDSVCYNNNRRRFNNWTEMLCSGYYVTGATVAFRRALFEKAYPFSDLWHHDGWLAMFASLYGKIYEEKEKLILYRQHADNQIGAITENSLREKIKNKIIILKKISKNQRVGRSTNAQRYRELYERIKMLDNNKDVYVIKNCVEAQNVMTQIGNVNKIRSLKVIIDCCLKGYYKKYRKKPFGFCMGDIISCFISE